MRHRTGFYKRVCFRIQTSGFHISHGHVNDGGPLRLSLAEGEPMGDI